ncbi:hypothetical protein [Clostridium disporicum]|uniref:hypothetical protein n=1 Tax=Clostridium disporicum TaxID=84024 RepID=UPI0034A3B395
MRKREEIIRDSSLFEDEREVNIPVYADDKLQNKIKNRELELERKLKEKERLKDKEYRKKKKEEYKKTLIPISEINVILKILFIILISTSIFAIFKLNIIQSLYGLIGAFLTVYVGRRSRLKEGALKELDNALLWNLSEVINQIVEYKTDYDIKGSYVSIFNKVCYLLIISLLLFNSSGFIYITSVILFIISLLICVGFKDFEPIINNQPLIMGCALIGVIVKFTFALFFNNSISIDCFNVLIILVLNYLEVLKHFKIEEPK